MKIVEADCVGEAGVVVDVPPSLDMAARVRGPKYPTAGAMPFAFWNLASAASVAGPKYEVS